jgi:hypothetical protein
MRPVGNERTTLVYRGPTPDIGDLECERIRPGVIRSFWLPTSEELAKLNAGGVVELVLWAEPIPPISLNALTPVEANEDFE